MRRKAEAIGGARAKLRAHYEGQVDRCQDISPGYVAHLRIKVGQVDAGDPMVLPDWEYKILFGRSDVESPYWEIGADDGVRPVTREELNARGWDLKW